MANAPAAIWQVWHDVDAKVEKRFGAVLAGIVGDKNHSFGFHLSPNDLRDLGESHTDYSMQTKRDRQGAVANPDYASALDIHFEPAGMVAVTKRLIASANDPNDDRLDCCYEFCGTTNGSTPHPFTVDGRVDDPHNTQGWDSGHVSHVHISFHRDVCNDYPAIKGVADVIAGIPLEKEFTVDAKAQAEFDEVNAKLDYLTKMFLGSDGQHHTVEVAVAHVTQGAGYLSKKGTLWQRLFRKADATPAPAPAVKK